MSFRYVVLLLVFALSSSIAFGQSSTSAISPASHQPLHGSRSSPQSTLSSRIFNYLFIQPIPTNITQACKRIEAEKSVFPQDPTMELLVSRLQAWNEYKVCGENYQHWKWWSSGISLHEDGAVQKGLVEFEELFRSRNEQVQTQLKKIDKTCRKIESELSAFPSDLKIIEFQQKFVAGNDEACRKTRKWTRRSLDVLDDLTELSNSIRARNEEITRSQQMLELEKSNGRLQSKQESEPDLIPVNSSNLCDELYESWLFWIILLISALLHIVEIVVMMR
jgi:hypothetical protein